MPHALRNTFLFWSDFFCCDFNLTSSVFFSPRASSGSTIEITTLSFPNCSTASVSRCPAGSEKNWSTPGSSTTAGAPQLHTLNHRSTLLGDTGLSGLECWRSQIVLKETEVNADLRMGRPARTQNFTAFFPDEQDNSGSWARRERSCFLAADSSPLFPWASRCRYSPAGQTRTLENHNPGPPLCPEDEGKTQWRTAETFSVW